MDLALSIRCAPAEITRTGPHAAKCQKGFPGNLGNPSGPMAPALNTDAVIQWKCYDFRNRSRMARRLQYIRLTKRA